MYFAITEDSAFSPASISMFAKSETKSFSWPLYLDKKSRILTIAKFQTRDVLNTKMFTFFIVVGD
jgi:hypothetical protein